MREKLTQMVPWMPSFISFFEMPSIMNLASLLLLFILTQTCAAREEGLVEVLIVDRHCFDQRRAHTHHRLSVLGPEKKPNNLLVL